MIITDTIAYAVNAELTSPRWCNAFAAGARCGISTDYSVLLPGKVALFGSPALWPLLRKTQQQNRKWFYGDHSYFGVLRGRYYRITRNAYQIDGSGNAEPKRWQALGLEIKPWRRGGRVVLVCAQSQAHYDRHGVPHWLESTLTVLKSHTDRPIVVRSKRDATPLAHALRDAWCVVAHTSAAATDAILAGVPAIVTGTCGASWVAGSSIASIEKPRYSTRRQQWAANLAANQWTLQEIKQGAMNERISGHLVS